jgi:hypothetical protein
MRILNRHAQRQATWLIALSMTFAGCSSKPKELLVPVRGKITLDGQPLPRGSVTLRVEQPGQTWHQPTGTIETPGQYVVYTNGRSGAPPGSYRVVVFATEALKNADGAAHPGLPQSIIPARYNQPDATPLRLTVSERPSSTGYDLELKSHVE